MPRQESLQDPPSAGLPHREQTAAEEIANSITHGAGFLLGIAGLVVLVVLAAGRRDAWRVVSFAIYGATLVLLYLASTLYHGLPPGKAKDLFNRIDHASIYLLVAGTYTPFLLVPLRGGWGWSLFGVIWGIALLGIPFQAIHSRKYRTLSLASYLVMGWIVIIAIRPLLRVLPPGGLLWLLAGGLCYTLGVIFYTWRSMRFAHAVWHVFVLSGSLCHFMGILLYIA